ncbi:hypothetical protein BJX68DRAFT_173134 [Aspergillus pseudodeflectus]|uniref:Uncharacterized protein n=1 Tax=Aspergillus pseudodeflectus TaxID=176178 RepID=A0ABR4JMM3_9EURO
MRADKSLTGSFSWVLSWPLGDGMFASCADGGGQSTSDEGNTANIASMSIPGWNSSHSLSSLGLYPSPCCRASAAAVDDLNRPWIWLFSLLKRVDGGSLEHGPGEAEVDARTSQSFVLLASAGHGRIPSLHEAQFGLFRSRLRLRFRLDCFSNCNSDISSSTTWPTRDVFQVLKRQSFDDGRFRIHRILERGLGAVFECLSGEERYFGEEEGAISRDRRQKKSE